MIWNQVKLNKTFSNFDGSKTSNYSIFVNMASTLVDTDKSKGYHSHKNWLAKRNAEEQFKKMENSAKVFALTFLLLLRLMCEQGSQLIEDSENGKSLSRLGVGECDCKKRRRLHIPLNIPAGIFACVSVKRKCARTLALNHRSINHKNIRVLHSTTLLVKPM